jgi:hypothetical protein
MCQPSIWPNHLCSVQLLVREHRALTNIPRRVHFFFFVLVLSRAPEQADGEAAGNILGREGSGAAFCEKPECRHSLAHAVHFSNS